MSLSNTGSTASVNLADVSQFLVGSDTLKLTPFFIKNFTIPSIAFAHIGLMNRSGVALHAGADSIDFNDLSLDIMLDSGFQTYFELLDLAMQEVNFEQDIFSTPTFDLWVQVLNSSKEILFRVDFKNCRIASIGEISLDPSAELGASLNVGIVYDYWTYHRSNCHKEIRDNSPIQGIDQTVLDSSGTQKGPNRWINKPLSNVRI